MSKPTDEVRLSAIYQREHAFRQIVDTYADLDQADKLTKDEHYLYVGYLMGVIVRLEKQRQRPLPEAQTDALHETNDAIQDYVSAHRETFPEEFTAMVDALDWILNGK